MSPTFMICVADFRDFTDFVANFPPCIIMGGIRVTQTGLSRTCHWLCCKHLNTSRWFVSTTFLAGKFRWKSV